MLLRRLREILAGLRLGEWTDLGAGKGSLLLLGALLFFGLLNCVLGYRLMRFWMMLVGLLVGAGLGFALCWYRDIPQENRRTYLLAMLVAGFGVALVTFLYYRAGIFLMVAALGIVLSIYVILPNSSAMFYLCLLLGIALALLALRFDREIIIFTTSLFGGALSGYCLSKIFALEELPYGLAMAAGLSFLGMLLQLALNPSLREKPEEEEEEAPREVRRRERGQSRSQNDAFYERYLDGEDVFDTRVVPRRRKR